MRYLSFERRFLIPAGICISGIALSVLLAFLFWLNRDAQLEQRFAASTNQIYSLIDARMTLYANVLYGAEGLFAASESVSEEEWRAYVDALDIPKNYRGISGMLFIKRVPRAELESFPLEIYPASEKPEYFPITYSVNMLATSTAFGFDVSSEPGRQSALLEASSTGQPRATPVVLSAGATPVPVFSIYVPVRLRGNEMNPVDGYVGATFRVKELFEGLAADPVFDRNIDVVVKDPGGTVLLDTGASRSHRSEVSTLSRTETIVVSGRAWQVEFKALQSFSLGTFAQYLPWIVLLTGIAFSMLCAALARLFIISRERALSAKDTQLKSVVGQMPFGFLIEDEERRVLFANTRMLEIFNGQPGMSTDGLIGKDTRALAEATKLLVAEYETYRARIEEIVRAHTPVFGEKVALAGNRTITRDYVPLIDGGRIIGGMWTFKDITELGNIDRAKTEFVSLASHQLRTPLTSIKWYAELLLEDVAHLSPEHQEYATEIRRASERTNGLVSALLDVSRLELGTFIIEPKPKDLVDLMQSAVNEQLPSFEKKHQNFSFQHPDLLPKVPVDRKLFFIIVQNLISNAHKYTPEGGTITLALSRDANGSFIMSCTDSGYGIPKAQQGSVFKKLFRADNIRTLDVEGTGLGLYVIKSIVDAAGCTIDFVSEEGRGTTFTVLIPKEGMRPKEGTKTLGE